MACLCVYVCMCVCVFVIMSIICDDYNDDDVVVVVTMPGETLLTVHSLNTDNC